MTGYSLILTYIFSNIVLQSSNSFSTKNDAKLFAWSSISSKGSFFKAYAIDERST